MLFFWSAICKRKTFFRYFFPVFSTSENKRSKRRKRTNEKSKIENSERWKITLRRKVNSFRSNDAYNWKTRSDLGPLISPWRRKMEEENRFTWRGSCGYLFMFLSLHKLLLSAWKPLQVPNKHHRTYYSINFQSAFNRNLGTNNYKNPALFVSWSFPSYNWAAYKNFLLCSFWISAYSVIPISLGHSYETNRKPVLCWFWARGYKSFLQLFAVHLILKHNWILHFKQEKNLLQSWVFCVTMNCI